MKRALLWVGVMVLVVLLVGFVNYGGHHVKSDEPLLFFLGVAFLIWLFVGIAWGARGTVRYLRR